MQEFFIIIIIVLLPVRLDNIPIGLAREEKSNNFLKYIFSFLKSRAGSICLGMSQQDQFSSLICNDL